MDEVGGEFFKISESLGPKSQEVAYWLKDHTPYFLSRFADLSMRKLGGKGYQRISPEVRNRGLCKFNFGIDRSPLHPTIAQEDIRNGSMQFTGKDLCGYGNYVLGQAIQERFPKVTLNWISLYADMTERKPDDRLFPEKHHLLELTFDQEEPIVIDATYGQVEHDKRLLITPSTELTRYYRDYTKQKDMERKSYSEARDKFLKEFRSEELPITTDDLTELIQTFKEDVLPVVS